MTVGGLIRNITIEQDARLLLVQGTGGEVNDWLHLRVALGSEPLKIGDALWWQGRVAYWTPLPERDREDVPIARIGYSWSVTADERRALNERKFASVS